MVLGDSITYIRAAEANAPYNTKTKNVISMNMIARQARNATEPLCVAGTNCGKKARKNNESLGFKTFSNTSAKAAS